jgi:hypothetical protein
MSETNRKNHRNTSRDFVEAPITCQPFTSKETVGSLDGVMRNFSSTGLYIESDTKFNIGTVLIVRVTDYPAGPWSATGDTLPRSISLAEVKWHQTVVRKDDVGFGMGLRYVG